MKRFGVWLLLGLAVVGLASVLPLFWSVVWRVGLSVVTVGGLVVLLVRATRNGPGDGPPDWRRWKCPDYPPDDLVPSSLGGGGSRLKGVR